MEPIRNFEYLNTYYWRLFAILHFETCPSVRIRNQFQYLIFIFWKNVWIWFLMCCAIILYSILFFRHCCFIDLNRSVGHVNILVIVLINLLSSLISLLQSLFYYKHLQKLWIRLRIIDDFVRKRLNYQMDYRDFFQSFNVTASICTLLAVSNCILRLVFDRQWTSIPAQIAMDFYLTTHFYAKLHVIFVVELFHHILKKFNKYVNLAYHSNSSHLIFSDRNATLTNLKIFKEMHTNVWYARREIDAFFGLSLLLIICQTFFSASYTVYTMYSFWNIAALRMMS